MEIRYVASWIPLKRFSPKRVFSGARMDEIADRAGVNKASIYYHIGDKKTLYAHVLHDLFTDAANGFDMSLQQAKSPQEQMSLYVQRIARVMDEKPHRAIMMLREAAAGGEHFPDIVARDMADIIGKLATILSEGEEEGCFVHVNPLAVHLMVIGAFILYRACTPVREKVSRFSNTFEHTDGEISVFLPTKLSG